MNSSRTMAFITGTSVFLEKNVNCLVWIVCDIVSSYIPLMWVICNTKQTTAVNVVANMRKGRSFWKDKAKKSWRGIVFNFPSDTFIILFCYDADM